ncbi:MAG: FMN-binding protein [Staphylococcus equorum]|nr:FMN-binding protein [Atopostipes sp.]MDN6630545.1 FMN-binding protein [Staphylococcus equorum]
MSMDNTYTGSADGNHGKIEVSVNVSNNEITDVEILNHKETAGISDSAFKKTIDKIIEQQSVKVDLFQVQPSHRIVLRRL